MHLIQFSFHASFRFEAAADGRNPFSVIIKPSGADPITWSMISKAADKLKSQTSKVRHERTKFKKERKKIKKIKPMEAF